MSNDQTLFKYPETLESNVGEYPHYVTFTAMGKNGSQGTVALYLPSEALKSSYTQTYGDTDLGGVGVAVNDVSAAGAEGMLASTEAALGKAASLKNPIEAIKGLIGGAENLYSGLNLGPALAQATVNEAVRGAQGNMGQVVNALQRKAGKIINPHKAIIYQGAGGFRTFNFNYVMAPETETEASEIAKIVHFFKWHMHPGTPGTHEREIPGSSQTSTTVPNDISTSISLTYPEEFKIAMYVNRKATQGTTGNYKSPSVNPLFKIKNCFLENLNVDYATSGAPAFITKDGRSVPATTTMSMQFKETVLMTKNSIAKGF